MKIRTHTCGELKSKDCKKSVTLNGWVNTVRLHGQVVFIDLRDRYGKTQIVFNSENYVGDFDEVKKLSMEDVLSVSGNVHKRENRSINSDMPTGEIEVYASTMEILNHAEPLPFVISDRDSAEEDLRLKFRYLELRTEELQRNIEIRHNAYQAVRGYLTKRDFFEIETPVLMKSTPEGARDYLVPSRIHHGKFYALPQSPQVYKQLLMISGYDKYFQVVKCFRDEDLRADRQPEFTQIDIEMSFIDEEVIFKEMEGLTRHIFKSTVNIDLPKTFPRLTYDESMDVYGTDKPDTRFGMHLVDLKNLTDISEFNAFKSSPCVRGVVVNGGAKYSRKNIDDYTDFVKKYNAKGLAWMKMESDQLQGGISKFINIDIQKEIIESAKIENGDIIFLIGDQKETVLTALGALRLHIGMEEGLCDPNKFNPVWVTDFPMFEYDGDSKRYIAMHHPFTAPHPEDVPLLESDRGLVRSRAYDLVLNGTEIGGGSIRIHQSAIQQKVFEALGLDEAQAKAQFGFLLDALRYGAPPHGGIAFGIDRIVSMAAGEESIRDVIAFPKTQKASCLLTDAPGEVDAEQMRELGLRLSSAAQTGGTTAG